MLDLSAAKRSPPKPAEDLRPSKVVVLMGRADYHQSGYQGDGAPLVKRNNTCVLLGE